MRTNIVIDDKLMADVMASGDFKTKREAVEAGLKMLKRRKAYDALLAARGTLHWDDSDEAWERRRAEQTLIAAGLDASEAAAPAEQAAHEPAAPYTTASPTAPATAAAPKPKRVKKVTVK
ncbi:MAG: type II toxin-antitoxin system VapB family antitoxin [Hydrogenophaga sp.]|jgi:Arc/MetJ family transcription regulator|uniref:type II toxin-antitoxin system VapB family antitoxin n=1 Tax=Hydrogenophaga sp. TaxID=1904254 RepID=UPI0027176D4D|nr:type II toxin-antitoxin system VapB family antitoxin [Hydrogenophaga sp.]MDO9482146.1 type II toxin-antitoxin system VapB family antitoxin [Hydrogenophaga sp.]MDO9569678.1 type II toxin-antitoxin system VapB family antitoxin [Hydrogenophaga sp.]MDP2219963.1 type II toxin-antitoxin system VapB family antitoxin [Hydrogenophaga sp.]MDP3346411.1 type II toxin-antitoxin system VapB family antitoxin [Hydrogenophaga sp.]MDP3374150.1 type II toxin-antitoxin system VapB family antitoxin [Hydrogenoph